MLYHQTVNKNCCLRIMTIEKVTEILQTWHHQRQKEQPTLWGIWHPQQQHRGTEQNNSKERNPSLLWSVCCHKSIYRLKRRTAGLRCLDLVSFLYTWMNVLLLRGVAVSIIMMTCARYFTRPFFIGCEVPEAAVKLIALSIFYKLAILLPYMYANWKYWFICQSTYYS